MAFFIDNFTETSDTELSLHSPDTGTGWTKVRGINNGVKDLGVVSDLYADAGDKLDAGATPSGGNNDGGLYTADETYPSANYTVEAIFLQVAAADDPNWLAVRIQDVDNFYALRFTGAAAQLYKCVANSWTALGSDQGAVAAVNDKIELHINGTTLSFDINDVEQDSVTDSDISNAGKAGVGQGHLGAVAGDDFNAQELDSFAVTDLGGGSVSVDITANVVSATFSVLSPSVSIREDVIATPNVLTASFSVLSPSVSVDVSKSVEITPNVLSASFSVLSSNVNVSASKISTPNVLSATFSVLSPSIGASRSVNISVGVLGATFSVQSPSVSVTKSIVATPSELIATFSVQSPSVSVTKSVEINANVLTATFSVLSPSISIVAGVNVSANVLTATFSVQSPSVSIIVAGLDSLIGVRLVLESRIEKVINYDSMISKRYVGRNRIEKILNEDSEMDKEYVAVSRISKRILEKSHIV